VNATADACRSQLEQLLRRDLTGWEGLSHGCTEQDISQWLPLLPGEGLAHLGSDAVEYRFRVVEAGGLIEPVRLYFSDRTLCLARTGLWSTDRIECERVLQGLGDPLDRLDLGFGVQFIPGGEWVYPAQGLTVAVLPDTGLIAGVAAYRPTDVDTYRRCFQESSPVREFPSPRHQNPA
jgi:hypothetical protein